MRQLFSKDTGPLKEETEKDYCVKVSESISDVLREILENEDEYNTVRVRLTGVVADGAPSMQKGLRYVQQAFPNLVFLGRDLAHAARKCTQEAWMRETPCEQYWQRIWKDKRSLVPTIQNSHVLRAQLESAQRLVVAKDGCQAAGLTTILRHFSYAKQRYESQASPQLAYVLLLTSVSLLLAVRASDMKLTKKEREEAARWLLGCTMLSAICSEILKVFWYILLYTEMHNVIRMCSDIIFCFFCYVLRVLRLSLTPCRSLPQNSVLHT